MQTDCLRYLRCPKCGRELLYFLDNGYAQAHLNCGSGEHDYPVIGGIPRFVNPDNYASSFGFQWNKFSQIQLDSYNQSGFSEERFRTITEWTEQDLEGKLVLDAGCGAERFAEVVAGKYKANVVAVDLSSAVEVCQDNLKKYDPLVCQASIYELPFQEGTFDFVSASALFSIRLIRSVPYARFARWSNPGAKSGCGCMN